MSKKFSITAALLLSASLLSTPSFAEATQAELDFRQKLTGKGASTGVSQGISFGNSETVTGTPSVTVSTPEPNSVIESNAPAPISVSPNAVAPEVAPTVTAVAPVPVSLDTIAPETVPTVTAIAPISVLPAPPTVPAISAIEADPKPVGPSEVIKSVAYVPKEDRSLEASIRVTFASNSSALSRRAINELSVACNTLPTFPKGSVFQVIGHADSEGESEYNQPLSERRAKEVRRHLIEECNLSEASIIALGVGEQYARQDIVDPADRRVEFRLVGASS